MSSNGKHKTRKKHPNSNNDRTGKRTPQPPIHQPTLEPDKSGKDDQRRREDISNCDAIQEYMRGEPAAL